MTSRVLVLGASGVLGGAIARHLADCGYAVRAHAREAVPLAAADPRLSWCFADLRSLRSDIDWRQLLAGCTAVINVAGALQDGLRDDLEAVHLTAIKALATALGPAGVRRVVHISAPGASHGSDTVFMRSKAAGDQAIRASGVDWIILRPALVIAPDAYGGTALLRALAACPLVIPAVHPESLVQTVSINDLTEAVSMCLGASVPAGSDVVLGEPRPQTLKQVLLIFRNWLGMPLCPVVAVPRLVSLAISALADVAGLLGWRSPLRTTALAIIRNNVAGDPQPWREIAGRDCLDLETSLGTMRANAQERQFARLYLLKPIVFVALSVFWLVSGLVAMVRFDATMMVLASQGIAGQLVPWVVSCGALANVTLGLAVLFRPRSVMALKGMIVLSLAYLIGASFAGPVLWLDPLGPLIKIIPGMVLAAVGLAIFPER